MYINWWMDKDNVVEPYHGLFSHRKEWSIDSAPIGMNLETMWSERRKTEKAEYCTILLI